MMSEMTASEKAWFNSLYRLMAKMPAEVEIQVHSGSIQMNREGAKDAYFEKYGDSDNVEELDSFVTHAMRIYPCSESV